MTDKQRVIQEYVPGKQITLAHIIASPNADIYEKLGLLTTHSAIGIMTITPSEAAIIASDLATKASHVDIGFLDRFSGSVVISGDIGAVEAALGAVVNGLESILGFASINITRT